MAHYIIDGSNIVYLPNSSQMVGLLALLNNILDKGHSFLCYFDAATKYFIRRQGQGDVLAEFIAAHPEFVSEIIGAAQADEFILLAADRDNISIISNDRYEKYIAQYGWLPRYESRKQLGDPSRLIAVNFIPGRLQVPRLQIDAMLDGDIDQQLQRLRDNLAKGSAVLYGSIIKLRHNNSGRFLHSHPFQYGHSGSSHQQQVTCWYSSDLNDYWIVKEPNGQDDEEKGTTIIRDGDIIRLEHLATRRNLHSHSGFPSPITGEQEVTACGRNGVSDQNDNWRVEVAGGGDWNTGKAIKLLHEPTGVQLDSRSDKTHTENTKGQQEVCGYRGLDDSGWWQATIMAQGR